MSLSSRKRKNNTTSCPEMKPLPAIALLVVFLLPEGLPAQEIFLKNGSSFPLKNPRRQGDMLLLSVTTPGATGSGEIGYKLTDVEKVEMPMPPALDAARSQLYLGKPAEALTTIKPAFDAVNPLRGISGSNWEETALLYAGALQAGGQTREAITILEQFEGVSPSGSPSREIARVRLAGLKTPLETAQVVGIADKALAAKLGSDVAAEANTVAGDAYLASKNFDDALNRYLKVVIFCPSDRWLGARSLLGAAKAMGSLNEKKNCVRTLREITISYPGSPQAEAAAKMMAAGGKEYEELAAEIDQDAASAKQRLIEASAAQNSN